MVRNHCASRMALTPLKPEPIDPKINKSRGSGTVIISSFSSINEMIEAVDPIDLVRGHAAESYHVASLNPFHCFLDSMELQEFDWYIDLRWSKTDVRYSIACPRVLLSRLSETSCCLSGLAGCKPFFQLQLSLLDHVQILETDPVSTSWCHHQMLGPLSLGASHLNEQCLCLMIW